MFDPYHKWLGIPRDQRPPSYYQLLGIAPDETDSEVIEEAALMRIAHVRNYQLGPHADECSQLLRELGEASDTLCDPGKRADYDARMLPRQEAESASQPAEADAPASAAEDAVPAATPTSPLPSPPFPLPKPPPPSSSPEPHRPRPPSETFDSPVPRYPPPPAPAPPEPRRPRSPSETFDSPVPRYPSPPATAPSNAGVQPPGGKPVSTDRPEDVILQELSNEALSDLRRPLDPEAESLPELARQLFQEWVEQYPWLPTFLRRASIVLGVIVASAVVFYVARRFL